MYEKGGVREGGYEKGGGKKVRERHIFYIAIE